MKARRSGSSIEYAQVNKDESLERWDLEVYTRARRELRVQEVKLETVSKFKRAFEEEVTRFRALNSGMKDTSSHLTMSLTPGYRER